MLTHSDNTVWFDGYITRSEREISRGHAGCAIWITGLSAAGKSTIAKSLEKILHDNKCMTYVLDGDNVRRGLCGDLGFSRQDRSENIRRIGETAKLFVDAGIIVIAAFISPYRKDREKIRDSIGKEDFIEVFADCPVEVCRERDPKNIYKKAENGAIKNLTGVNARYEKPEDPEIYLETHKLSISESVMEITHYLSMKEYTENLR
ncbi:adenosine 5'-phosphosulfate kinase [Candidatus Desulfarcum epimagneticum]|uniref:Adenylyl-sulfate kinase n=1 Tax=uncultured Desulfobacteraceae bacterium TaxID=218296 RepID=A0A484HNX2_9BACT|nr:adenosine 5'-phosphosulfate kinase [uncultured Desulfobacteraceae bacterium]